MCEEVGPVEALAELRLEALGEPFQDPLAVVGPLLPRLLFLDDDAADLPVGLDHGRVDRLPGPVPGRGEDLADLAVKRQLTNDSADFDALASRRPPDGWTGGFLDAFFFFAMPMVYHTPGLQTTASVGDGQRKGQDMQRGFHDFTATRT